jgi:hypothetical protein
LADDDHKIAKTTKEKLAKKSRKCLKIKFSLEINKIQPDNTLGTQPPSAGIQTW